MSTILFSSRIGPIPVSVIISEDHCASIGITEIPIETGAKVSDHSYVEPKKLDLEFGDENGTATYEALVRFQESRTPFVMMTGFKMYSNMLIKELKVKRDEDYSRVLKGTASLQEVIIVMTSSSQSSSGGQAATKGGNPGGANSTMSAPPTKTTTFGAGVPDRASGLITRGDQANVAGISLATLRGLIR
jgi:hypothetical protein